MPHEHLITEAELRAAGALDVPEGWRKSLSKGKDLFSDADDAAEGRTGKAERDAETEQNPREG